MYFCTYSPNCPFYFLIFWRTVLRFEMQSIIGFLYYIQEIVASSKIIDFLTDFYDFYIWTFDLVAEGKIRFFWNLHTDVQLFQYHLLDCSFFSHLDAFKIYWPCMCEPIARLLSITLTGMSVLTPKLRYLDYCSFILKSWSL